MGLPTVTLRGHFMSRSFFNVNIFSGPITYFSNESARLSSKAMNEVKWGGVTVTMCCK